jgi:D-beta-D-heptose 7-phosphate kinase/D-beta-D-heptose 1-phosphate adenosyltransferase
MANVLELEAAIALRQAARRDGRLVVLTNGLFDLLHVGHLDYLERAGNLGDVLIVGVNSDLSARTFKGPGHPVVPAPERARLLAALCIVDVVVIFDEPTASELVRALQPDVYVKGGDYTNKPWPEREVALATGCRVELIPILEGHSTSTLVQSILASFGRQPDVG